MSDGGTRRKLPKGKCLASPGHLTDSGRRLAALVCKSRDYRYGPSLWGTTVKSIGRSAALGGSRASAGGRLGRSILPTEPSFDTGSV